MKATVTTRLKLNETNIEKVITEQVQLITDNIIKDVTTEINNYIDNLKGRIGTIGESAAYRDSGISWSPVNTKNKKANTFWYESGAVKEDLTLQVVSSKNQFRIIAGITPAAASYDETVWNEFGFFPINSGKMVRRPLFTPLAEASMAAIRDIIKAKYTDNKITIQLSLAHASKF